MVLLHVSASSSHAFGLHGSTVAQQGGVDKEGEVNSELYTHEREAGRET